MGLRGPKKGAGGRPAKKTAVEILSGPGSAEPETPEPPPVSGASGPAGKPDITATDLATLWEFGLSGVGMLVQSFNPTVPVKQYWQTTPENLNRLGEASARLMEKYGLAFKWGPELAFGIALSAVFGPATMATLAAINAHGPLPLQPFRQFLTGAEWDKLVLVWKSSAPAVQASILRKLEETYHVANGHRTNGGGENPSNQAPHAGQQNPPVDRDRPVERVRGTEAVAG